MAYLTPPYSRRMLLLHHDFRRFLDALDDLNPAQIEDAQKRSGISNETRNVKLPPRPQWEDFTPQGLKMMRGLLRWQLPILTVADLGGSCLFRRLPNRRRATVESAMKPLVPGDAVLC